MIPDTLAFLNMKNVFCWIRKVNKKLVFVGKKSFPTCCANNIYVMAVYLSHNGRHSANVLKYIEISL